MMLFLPIIALLAMVTTVGAGDIVAAKTDSFDARWAPLFYDKTPIAEWRYWDWEHYRGPFMMAADPRGIIVWSPVPLLLDPDGLWDNVMAKGDK